jgi:hypothetical protein
LKHEVAYKQAFVSSISAVLNISAAQVSLPFLKNSTVGTALLVCTFLVEDRDAAIKINQDFQAQFSCTTPTVRTGSPACSTLISVFNSNGLPVTAAYYVNQNTPTHYIDKNSGKIVTEDVGEVIAIDINYVSFVENASAYTAAFISGLADALNVSSSAIVMEQTNLALVSKVGNALLYFNILLPSYTSSSSNSVINTFQSVQSLFNCTSTCTVGTPAGPTSALVRALQKYGLPLTNAYYNDQLA